MTDTTDGEKENLILVTGMNKSTFYSYPLDKAFTSHSKRGV